MDFISELRDKVNTLKMKVEQKKVADQNSEREDFGELFKSIKLAVMCKEGWRFSRFSLFEIYHHFFEWGFSKSNEYSQIFSRWFGISESTFKQLRNIDQGFRKELCAFFSEFLASKTSDKDAFSMMFNADSIRRKDRLLSVFEEEEKGDRILVSDEEEEAQFSLIKEYARELLPFALGISVENPHLKLVGLFMQICSKPYALCPAKITEYYCFPDVSFLKALCDENEEELVKMKSVILQWYQQIGYLHFDIEQSVKVGYNFLNNHHASRSFFRFEYLLSDSFKSDAKGKMLFALETEYKLMLSSQTERYIFHEYKAFENLLKEVEKVHSLASFKC